MFQTVPSMSPTRARISSTAIVTAACSSASLRRQTPAQRRSEPTTTQYRSSTNPLGTLRRLEIELGILREGGQLRARLERLGMPRHIKATPDQPLLIVLDREPYGDEGIPVLVVGEQSHGMTLGEGLDPGRRADEVLEAQDREPALTAGDRHARDLQVGLVDGEQGGRSTIHSSGESHGSTMSTPSGLRCAAIAAIALPRRSTVST